MLVSILVQLILAFISIKFCKITYFDKTTTVRGTDLEEGADAGLEDQRVVE